jgi:hypothetical protein
MHNKCIDNVQQSQGSIEWPGGSMIFICGGSGFIPSLAETLSSPASDRQHMTETQTMVFKYFNKYFELFSQHLN